MKWTRCWTFVLIMGRGRKAGPSFGVRFLWAISKCCNSPTTIVLLLIFREIHWPRLGTQLTRYQFYSPCSLSKRPSLPHWSLKITRVCSELRPSNWPLNNPKNPQQRSRRLPENLGLVALHQLHLSHHLQPTHLSQLPIKPLNRISPQANTRLNIPAKFFFFTRRSRMVHGKSVW